MKLQFIFLALFGFTVAQWQYHADGDHYDGDAYEASYEDHKGYVLDREQDPEFRRDRKHWRWMGAILWLRSFQWINSLTYFPTAVIFARLNRGHAEAFPKYMWTITWWSGVCGVITSAFNMFIGFHAIIKPESYAKGWMDTWSETSVRNAGISIIVTEIIGASLFFFFRKGSIRYATYLRNAWEGKVEEEDMGF